MPPLRRPDPTPSAPVSVSVDTENSQSLGANIAEVAEEIEELSEAHDASSPRHLVMLGVFIVLAEIVVFEANLVPFAGIIVGWILSIFASVGFQSYLLFSSQANRRLRRTRRILVIALRTASLLELIPVVGAAPIYIIAFAVVYRKYAKEHDKIGEELEEAEEVLGAMLAQAKSQKP